MAIKRRRKFEQQRGVRTGAEIHEAEPKPRIKPAIKTDDTAGMTTNKSVRRRASLRRRETELY